MKPVLIAMLQWGSYKMLKDPGKPKTQFFLVIMGKSCNEQKNGIMAFQDVISI